MAPAKKSVAKKTAKDKTKVTKVNDDPLADLGLETEATEAVVAPAAAAAVAVAAAAVAPAAEAGTSDEVDVGEIEFGFSEFIPTAKRKAEGSKYKFDKLAAPKKEGDKTLYANFQVKLQPGVDADKLRRSVQSATTQANKQGKDEGKYFVSRTVTKDGEFVGMIVYRTDVPPTK